jgi:uncharacterized Zn finger protein
LFDLDEDAIRQNSSPQSFERGLDYYGRGSVVSMIRRGEELRAEVAGSEFAPYDVRVVFDVAGMVEAWCSCPYDWGGWCKHIVATLLCEIHEPESVRELPAIEEVLSGLDREELKGILLRLVDQDPRLADAIEGEVSLPQGFSSGSQEASRVRVNVGSIRHRVHNAIRSLDRMRPSEAYWHVGGVVEEVRRILEVARNFIEVGDADNALCMLEAITDEYTKAWEYLDDSDGYVGDFFYELGETWTEAILSAELTRSERRSWREKLETWCEELEMYAGGEAFHPALLAAKQGWDHPTLTRVLGRTGEVTADPGVEPEAASEQDEHPNEDYVGELIVVRLNVLQRQGRHEEYLRLAEHAGEVSRYAVMLVRLGRTEEAIEYGLEHLRAPEEALAVAEALCESEESEGALRIGELGLTLAGRKAGLAAWLCDLASEMGRVEQALRAAVIVLREDPTLTAYLQVQELSGERWSAYRDDLLDHLRRNQSYHPSGHVEVFLHEGLIRDAITAVEKRPVGALIGRVADAAVESHPDWVIDTCSRQAGEIMDEGRSRHYSEAIGWLKKVRAAYHAAGREGEWQRYLEGLIARHGRKYKLRPMLESLGWRA